MRWIGGIGLAGEEFPVALGGADRNGCIGEFQAGSRGRNRRVTNDIEKAQNPVAVGSRPVSDGTTYQFPGSIRLVKFMEEESCIAEPEVAFEQF